MSARTTIRELGSALTAVLLVAGCRAPVAEMRRPCASRPADFQRWADFPADIGGARWIVPPSIDAITLTSAGLHWNGVALDLTGPADGPNLDAYLAQVARLEPQPITAFDVDRGVRCATVERVRALMRRHLDCARSLRCFQGRSMLPVVN